jgi:hypothetical protein
MESMPKRHFLCYKRLYTQTQIVLEVHATHTTRPVNATKGVNPTRVFF